MKKIKSFLNFLTKKALKIEKRVRFVTSTILLTLIMLIATFFFFDRVFIFVPIFILASYFLTYFAVAEGIEGVEWLTLFIIPLTICLSFYFFYFLFPIRWLTRIPFIILFGISIYANLLVSNIFNVRVEKSLQLYRAAFSVNFLFQTIVVFLLFNSVFSFHLGFIPNFLISTIIIFCLSLQLYWSVKMLPVFDEEVYRYSALTALVTGEIVMIFSFIPVKGAIFALLLAAAYYSLSGLIYSHIDQRLFRETIREYLFVLGFVLVIVLLSIRW